MLLHDLFLATAERMPEAPAFEFAGRTTSYGAAARQVRALAAALRRELAPGARIAIHMHKSETTIIVMLASLAAGMTYVPIDPRYPAERRRFVMADAGVAALFVDARTARDWDFGAIDPERLMLLVSPDGARAGGLCREFALAELLAGDAASRTSENPAADIAADDLAYILYTSGSTGTPKGVMISHRNAAAFVAWGREAFDIGPGDRLAVHAQLNFDLPVFDIYVGLASGATVVPIDEETVLYPQALMNFLKVGNITVLYAVPSALAALLGRSTLARDGLPDLRLLLYAGEEYHPGPLSELAAALPKTRIFNLYGPIETNVVTFLEIRPEHLALPRIPIGRPVHNAAVTLLDPDTGVAVETGSEGEIAVVGDCVSPGYLGRPDLTAATRINTASGVAYRTGDFGRLDKDGVIHFLGRRDTLVKVRGFRIELGDVEAALTAHPDVAEAAVIALPDPATTSRLHAFVLPRTAGAVSVDELLRWCRDRLPDYMHPAAIDIRDAFPRTNSGKIARKELARSLAEKEPAE